MTGVYVSVRYAPPLRALFISTTQRTQQSRGWVTTSAVSDLSRSDRNIRMMSAAQTLKSKLKALECHFTWDADKSRSELFRLKDKLVDIGTDEGNYWLGHIYNLQGYIHYKLALTEDAQRFFNKATETFHRSTNSVSDEGPWLVVNYGNLAWLHHHLGEEAESQTYLSKVDTLLKEYPPPSEDELHPEIYAEKAWTLMKFGKDRSEQVTDYFQKAIRMQPDMVEWHTSYVIGRLNSLKHCESPLEEEILDDMRLAKEQDPENFYFAALDLDQRAGEEEIIEDEARELARKVLRNPVSSYSGFKALLRLYKKHLSADEAIALAEEALGKHPDERFLKRCAALCYKWKILFSRDSPIAQTMIDRALSLLEEVISLYPHSSLVKKIDLASVSAKSNQGPARAGQIYQQLLEMDLDPPEKQLLYNGYAKYLTFDLRDNTNSIDYHMMAAEIPVQSFYRQNSIKVLKKIKDKKRNRRCREIERFLANLDRL